ncbi:glycosyl hydrolase, partial [Stenotrophomonas maltophilia]
DLYPQGDSQYTLYEDDGNTRRYQQGESSTQQIRVQAPALGSGPVQVQIDAVQGQYNGQLAQRRYGLRVILPMYPSMLFDGEKPLDEVTFDLYPQGDSQYTLYEDDGNTRRYQQGESSTQQIR